jgi:hypothetical protein
VFLRRTIRTVTRLASDPLGFLAVVVYLVLDAFWRSRYSRRVHRSVNLDEDGTQQAEQLAYW